MTILKVDKLLEDLKSRIEGMNLNDNYSGLKDRIGQIERMIPAKKPGNEEYGVKGILGKLDEINIKLNELDQRLRNAEQTRIGLDNLQSKIRFFEDRVNKETSSYENVHTKMSVLEKNIYDLIENAKENAEKHLINKFQSLSGRLEGKIDERTSGIANQKDLEEVREDFKTIKGDFLSILKEIGSLKEKYVNSLSDVENVARKLRENDEKIENSVFKEISKLSEKLDVFRSDVSELGKGVDELIHDLEENKAKTKRMDESLIHLRESYSEQEDLYSKLWNKIDSLKDNHDGVKKNLEELSSLKSKLNFVEDNMRDLPSLDELKNLEEETKLLREDLKRVKSESGKVPLLENAFPNIEDRINGLYENSKSTMEKIKSLEEKLSRVRENANSKDGLLKDSYVNSAERKLAGLEGKLNEVMNDIFLIKNKQIDLEESVTNRKETYENSRDESKNLVENLERMREEKAYKGEIEKDIESLRTQIEETKKKNKELIEMLLEKIGV